MVAFGGQHSGHILIGDDPIMHDVARSAIVPVANFHPDAKGFDRAIGDEVFMQLPCAVRQSPG